MKRIHTLVIGGGQAGLAMSACLSDRQVDHVVLERGRVAERWRAERWDSLRLLTPNWMSRLPGFGCGGGSGWLHDDAGGHRVLRGLRVSMQGTDRDRMRGIARLPQWSALCDRHQPWAMAGRQRRHRHGLLRHTAGSLSLPASECRDPAGGADALSPARTAARRRSARGRGICLRRPVGRRDPGQRPPRDTGRGTAHAPAAPVRVATFSGGWT